LQSVWKRARSDYPVKIRRLHIDGFGPFAGREFGGLSPGLNLLFGPNEAGKSAVRAFIRAVLFGFVTGRSKADERALYDYPPTAGGVEGGIIELTGEDGSLYTVERYRRKPTPAAGELLVTRDDVTGGQDMLDGVLHRVGARVYQNVFSIGLEELRSLDSEMQDQIAAAGLGSTGDALPRISGRLDSELGALRRELGVARTKIREVRAEYEAAQIDLQHYDALVAEHEKAEAEIERVSRELGQTRERMTRLTMLSDSRESWNRMQEIQRQMEELPRRAYLPPQPVKLLEEIEERCRTLSGSIREDEDAEEERKRELESLSPDIAPDLCGEAVGRLIARQSEYMNAIQDVESVRARVAESVRRLEQGLAALGRDWDEAKLESFDDSLAVRSTLEQLEQTLERTGRESDLHARATGQIDTEGVAAAEAHSDAARRLELLGTPPEMTLKELSARRNALNRLRALAAERPSAQRNLEQAAERFASSSVSRRSRLALAAQFGISAGIAAAGLVLSLLSLQLGESKVALMGYIVGGVGGLGMLVSFAVLRWPFMRRGADVERPASDAAAQAVGTDAFAPALDEPVAMTVDPEDESVATIIAGADAGTMVDVEESDEPDEGIEASAEADDDPVARAIADANAGVFTEDDEPGRLDAVIEARPEGDASPETVVETDDDPVVRAVTAAEAEILTDDERPEQPGTVIEAGPADDTPSETAAQVEDDPVAAAIAAANAGILTENAGDAGREMTSDGPSGPNTEITGEADDAARG